MSGPDGQRSDRPVLTPEQIDRRREAGRRMEASSRIEGLPCNPEHDDLAELVAIGEMTSREATDEVARRVRARRSAIKRTQTEEASR